MAKQREAGLENTAGINLCVTRAAQEKARRRSESKQAEDQPSSWEVCALCEDWRQTLGAPGEDWGAWDLKWAGHTHLGHSLLSAVKDNEIHEFPLLCAQELIYCQILLPLPPRYLLSQFTQSFPTIIVLVQAFAIPCFDYCHHSHPPTSICSDSGHCRVYSLHRRQDNLLKL